MASPPDTGTAASLPARRPERPSSQPVYACSANFQRITDPNAKSGCDGGSAFSCADQTPWAVTDVFAYRFAATSLAGGSEASWCCACYEPHHHFDSSVSSANPSPTPPAECEADVPNTCVTQKWGQCGGIGFTGCLTCVGGTTCQKQNDWYYQCL